MAEFDNGSFKCIAQMDLNVAKDKRVRGWSNLNFGKIEKAMQNCIVIIFDIPSLAAKWT